MERSGTVKKSYPEFKSGSSAGGIEKRADAGFWSPEYSREIADIRDAPEEFTMPEGQAAELLTQYFSPNVIDTARGKRRNLWNGSRDSKFNVSDLMFHDCEVSREIGGVDNYLDGVNRMLSAQAPNVMPNGMTREAYKAWGSWDRLDEAFRKYIREPARKARSGRFPGNRLSSDETIRFYIPDHNVRAFSAPGMFFHPASAIMLAKDDNATTIAHEVGHSANRQGLLQDRDIMHGAQGGDTGYDLKASGTDRLSNYFMSTVEAVNPIAFMKRNMLMSGVLPENGKSYSFKEILDYHNHAQDSGLYNGMYSEENRHTGDPYGDRVYRSTYKGAGAGIKELLGTYNELKAALDDAEGSGDAERIRKAREMYEEFLLRGDALTQQVIAGNGIGRSMGKHAGDDSAGNRFLKGFRASLDKARDGIYSTAEAAADFMSGTRREEHDAIRDMYILGTGAEPKLERTSSYSPGAYESYRSGILGKEELTPLEESMLRKDIVPLSVTTKQLRAAIPELDSLPAEDQEYLMRLARNTAKINRIRHTGKIFPDAGSEFIVNPRGHVDELREQAMNILEDSLYTGESFRKMSPARIRLFKRLYPLRNSFTRNVPSMHWTGAPWTRSAPAKTQQA